MGNGSTSGFLDSGLCGPEDIPELAERLRKGELVGIPTETVYGLAADATDREACLRVYAAKGRPPQNPLIVHCSDAAEALSFAAPDLADDIRRTAQRIFGEFAPGPISLVLPSATAIAEAARAGQATVALRVPAHPLARALIRETGRPLAAPSANASGQPSPTDATAVRAAFGPDLPVLDGGPCEIGIESTVVELRADHLVLHRPGFVSRSDLRDATGMAVLDPGSESGQSPGRLHPHYRPAGPCWVLSPSELVKLAPAIGAANGGGSGFGQLRGLWIYGLEQDCIGAQDHVSSEVLRTEADASAVARNLFRVLVEADQRPLVLVAPEDSRWGEALADRMGPAASGRGAIALSRRLPSVGGDGDS